MKATGSRRGDLSPHWKDGRHRDSRGYIRVVVDGRKVLEHRYVMEQHLGRRLAHDEQVHHLNGDKHDNRIENLVVLGIVEHTLLHAQIDPTLKSKGRWARHYDACRGCGTTDAEHYGRGYCPKCYMAWRYQQGGRVPDPIYQAKAS